MSFSSIYFDLQSLKIKIWIRPMNVCNFSPPFIVAFFRRLLMRQWREMQKALRYRSFQVGEVLFIEALLYTCTRESVGKKGQFPPYVKNELSLLWYTEWHSALNETKTKSQKWFVAKLWLFEVQVTSNLGLTFVQIFVLFSISTPRESHPFLQTHTYYSYMKKNTWIAKWGFLELVDCETKSIE